MPQFIVVFANRRRSWALLAASAAVALILLAVVTVDFPTRQALQSSATTQASSSSVRTSSETSVRFVGEVTEGDIITEYPLSPCNCTINVEPYAIFPTLQNLARNSDKIWLANVTSASSLSVKGVPFTLYDITNVETLPPVGNYLAQRGTVAQIAWVGGTANGTTTAAYGYPALTVGGLYIFFLTSLNSGIIPANISTTTTATIRAHPFSPYWQQIDNGMAWVTAGGAQGLFYVQEGKVFSLDNVYPQQDAWLPVKVGGIPLAEFFAELESA